MIFRHLRRLVCLAVCAIAIAMPGMLQAAEVVVLPNSLGLPPGGTDSSTQSVFLRPAPSGSLKLKSVTVEYASGPEDTRLGTNAAKVVGFVEGANGTTVPVNIELLAAAFARVGTYKVALRVQGERIPQAPPPPQAAPQPTPVDELLELPLVRAQAQLTVNIPSNGRVTINRGFPWKRGGTKVDFTIAQDSGSAVDRLVVRAASVVRVSDNEMVPGSVALIPAAVAVTNGAGSAMLEFRNFENAGDFQTQLTFASPALAKPITIPVAIRVTDNWVLPLLAILAGVICGAAVHLMVRIWRPRQLTAYRLSQLQARLEGQARAIGTQSTRAEYDRLLRRLHVLAEGVALDLATEQAVQEIDTGINALETKLAQIEVDAGKALVQQRDALTKAIDDLSNYEPTAKAELERLQPDLAQCRQRLYAGYAEEAADCINAVKDKITSARSRLARLAINGMKREIDAIKDDDPRKKVLNDKAQAALTQVNQGAGDVGRLLAELRAAIDGASPPSQADFSPEQLRRLIEVSPEPSKRRAGSLLQFAIVPAPEHVRAIRWIFDGSPLADTSPTFKRTYPVPGNFAIAATIEYENAAAEDVGPLRISVLPSEAEGIGKSILANIRRLDWGLLALSIVVAAVTGLLDRYSGKAFGTVADYCWAFLWGLGIDNVIRGFSATFGRVTAKS